MSLEPRRVVARSKLTFLLLRCCFCPSLLLNITSSPAFTLPTIYQTNPPSVLISSSPKDELISSRQPLELKARLEGLGFKDTLRYEGDWLGKNGEEGNHDQLLKSESFGRLVKDWVKEEL